MSVPVLLDCDPGHDDAFALLLAAGDPDADLVGVTAVAGNQDVDTCWRNACHVLALAGMDEVPVGRGADRPLRRSRPRPSAVHGASGLDGLYGVREQAAGTGRGGVDAPEALALMARILQASAAPVTVVATGPLTNVARLVSSRPDLLERVAGVVWMGGSTGRRGLPAVETNASNDPEAVEVVVRSGVPMTVCGLDVTHQAVITQEVVAAFARLGTPLAGRCVDVLTYLQAAYRRERDLAEAPLHDPVALVRALDPSLVRCVPVLVDVDTGDAAEAGRTRIRRAEGSGSPEQVRFAVTLDADGFWARLLSAVGSLG